MSLATIAGATPFLTPSIEIQPGLTVVLARLFATINETFCRMAVKTRHDTLDLEKRYLSSSHESAGSKRSQGNWGLVSAGSNLTLFLSSFAFGTSDAAVFRKLSDLAPQVFNMKTTRVEAYGQNQSASSSLFYNQLQAKANEHQSDSNVKESFKQVFDSYLQLQRSASAPPNM